MTRGGARVPTLERTLSDVGGSVVKDDLDHMGPIDYLVIEFPDSNLTGEGMPLLAALDATEPAHATTTIGRV